MIYFRCFFVVPKEKKSHFLKVCSHKYVIFTPTHKILFLIRLFRTQKLGTFSDKKERKETNVQKKQRDKQTRKRNKEKETNFRFWWMIQNNCFRLLLSQKKFLPLKNFYFRSVTNQNIDSNKIFFLISQTQDQC